MSEPKHTPGPWKANFDEYTKPYIEITNEDNVVVAQIPDGEVIRGDKTILGLENIEANIKLITAAPDMYEALEHLRIVAQKVCDDFCCGAGCCSDATDCHLEAGLIHAEIALRKARGEAE